MKKCNSCGMQVEDQATVCSLCGSHDLSELEAPQTSVPTQNVTPAEPDLGNGNVVAGIVGAFLFALLGGLLYFVIYQVGIIAGICGLAIFVLANFGYTLFAKSNKNSMVGLVVSVVMMIVMIFVAEYTCLSYEIFKAFKAYDITFFDAVQATPQFMKEPEVIGSVLKDLGFAYLFGIIASISNIKNMAKANKK